MKKFFCLILCLLLAGCSTFGGTSQSSAAPEPSSVSEAPPASESAPESTPGDTTPAGDLSQAEADFLAGLDLNACQSYIDTKTVAPYSGPVQSYFETYLAPMSRDNMFYEPVEIYPDGEKQQILFLCRLRDDRLLEPVLNYSIFVMPYSNGGSWDCLYDAVLWENPFYTQGGADTPADAPYVIPSEGSINRDYSPRYENGLFISLPFQWWGRYTVVETDHLLCHSYAFRLGGDSRMTMFQLFVFLNDDYNGLSADAKAVYGKFLGSNEKFSFTYTASDVENPFPPGSEDSELFFRLRSHAMNLERGVTIDCAAAPEGRDAPTGGFPSLMLTGGTSGSLRDSQYALPGDETAELLATRILATFVYGGSGLSDFEGAGNAANDEMLAAALFHSPAACVPYTYRHGEPDSLNVEPGTTTGRLYQAAKAALEEDVGPDYLYYGEDVRRTAALIFGSEAKLTMADSGSLYHYYAEPDVFVRQGDYGGPVSPCPQILSYEKTADGYLCETAVADWIGDPLEIWVTDAEGNQTTLTRENIREAVQRSPRLRCTFTAEDGRLVLTGFQKLSDEA